MHRTTLVPQFLCWSVVLGLVIQAGLLVSPARGQGFVPPPPSVPFIQMSIGDSKPVQMSGKQQLITKVQVENPRIVQADPDPNNPRVVMITGLTAGRSRVYLVHVTDDKKEIIEAVDVYIPTGRESRMADLMRNQLERFNKLVKEAVPTANVQAHLAGETVILTGTAPDPETVNILLELARGVFRDVEGSEQLGGGPPVILPGTPAAGITQLMTMQRLIIVNAIRIGGVQQVQLEVVVARVARSEFRQLSFNWMQHGEGHTVGSNFSNPVMNFSNSPIYRAATQNPFHSIGTANFNAMASIVSDAEQQSFQGFLQAMRTEGLVKLLAEPKLVTLSGKPANFLSGGQQAVPTVSGFGGTAGVDFVPFGTQITFLPIVLGNGKIYLEVNPVVNRLDQSAGLDSPTVGRVPGRATQQVQTTVVVEDGETVVIGGLVQNVVNASAAKVPILGDLPFFGTLFRSVNFEETEEELIIMVTPRLVDPLSCDQLPKVLPGRETRSPDDFELFLEGILEAPRGCRKVCRGHKYVPAYRNGPTAGSVPCGLGGPCGPGMGSQGVPGIEGPGVPGMPPGWNGTNYDNGISGPAPQVLPGSGPEKGLAPSNGKGPIFPEKSLPMPPASSHNSQNWLPSPVSTRPGLIPGNGGNNSGATQATYGTLEDGPTSAGQPNPAPQGSTNPILPLVSKPVPSDPPPLPQATFGAGMPKDSP